jgi:cbb3-type cytochrome c oxidase subunit III
LARRASLLVLLALGLVGCGTGGLADEEATADGPGLFQQKCGSCHELAAAGTRGTIGPSLDAAFAAPRKEGFDESSIREVVLGQMRYPIAPMPEPDSPEMFPPSEWTDDEREDAMSAIAAYVASVAGDEEAIAQARRQRGAQGASDPRGLFRANCASCHTLAAAGASGTIGPNLDNSSIDVEAIEEQIRRGGGGMPAFEGQLTDEQIEALAKYVAESRNPR